MGWSDGDDFSSIRVYEYNTVEDPVRTVNLLIEEKANVVIAISVLQYSGVCDKA